MCSKGRSLAAAGSPSQQLAFAKVPAAAQFRTHWPCAGNRFEERRYSVGCRRGWGSLIYGNVLYEPSEQFYNDPQWASITDWKAELAPYYDQAKRMLGVATNPRLTPSDDILKSIADDLGVADTFHPTQVGVFFGEPARQCPTRTSVASDQTALAASFVRSA